MLMAYKAKMTRRQAKIVRARVLDPFASQSEIASKVGVGQRHVSRELAKPHVRDEVNALMDARPKLRLGALLSRLEEGLEATEIRSVKLHGTILKAEVEVEDQSVRHKFLDTALKMRKILGPEAGEAGSTGPVNIAIIMAGGGSDTDRAAMADVMVAARIARGLHPLENRRLTEKEAEEFRRPT